MKHIKLIVSFLTFVAILGIYLVTKDDRFTYLAIGDSLAAGQNPYGELSYGYSDYIASYLDRSHLLKFYTNDFAVSGYRTTDLLEDIKNNKKVTTDNKTIGLKAALRDADLITISIGANDFLAGLSLKTLDASLLTTKDIKAKVEEIVQKVDMLLKEVRKYAKNEVIVVGYYNPVPRSTALYQKEVDQLFDMIATAYQKLCDRYKMTYIDIYDQFKKNIDYLPNPLDIHPSGQGYEAIAQPIIDWIEKKVLN